MADQLTPIADDAFVYRRIPRSFYQGSLQPPVQTLAFRPNPLDTTELSVFRAAFVRPEETLTTIDPAKRNDYYVVSLAVADLRALGLTVVPRPDPQGPPGHAEIPELSWAAYQADKNRLKVVQVELARLASAAIVPQPS